MTDSAPITAAEFSGAMSRLGPWPDDRRVAVGVSGGADSLCLALLVKQWSRGRAKPLALIVDHGLRDNSAIEAGWTRDTLARFGIPSRTLKLEGLVGGARLHERARRRRYEALKAACGHAGLLDLLLGHHLQDQEETILMRVRAGTGPDGRAGMSAVSERSALRLVRPLLGFSPGRLRATLRVASIRWVEDPGNRDQRFARARLREEFATHGRPVLAGHDQTVAERVERGARADAVARWCARHLTLREEGCAILPAGALPPSVLSRLLQAISGREHPPPRLAVARLAENPRAATLHGVRLIGRGGGAASADAEAPGQGLLAIREPASMAAPVSAVPGALWDGRFRLSGPGVARLPPGWQFGAVGAAAARLRSRSPLPAAALSTLPALLDPAGNVRIVPHLGIDLGPVPASGREGDQGGDGARAGACAKKNPPDPGEFSAIFSPRVPIAPSFFI